MTAAERFRITDAENAGSARLAVQLAGEFLGLFPVVDVRQDFPLDETANGIPHQLMRLVEVFLEYGHGEVPG
ncbi:hypothetical protein D3C76_1548830 [compost metagenome]